MRRAMPRKQTMAKRIRELEMELAYRKASEPDARVRELEAELEELQKDDAIIALMVARKRAEKVEQMLEGMRAVVASHVQARRAAEARVAELTEAIRQHDEYCPDECEYIEGGRWLPSKPAPAIEGHEREASK